MKRGEERNRRGASINRRVKGEVGKEGWKIMKDRVDEESEEEKRKRRKGRGR